MKQKTGKAGTLDLPADLIAELDGMESSDQVMGVWTEKEIAVLRQYYTTLGPAQLAKFFAAHAEELESPRPRSAKAIKVRANQLGFARKKKEATP